MSRTIVVTGGAGFIGSTIVDRLVAAGDRAIVLDDLSTGSENNLAGALDTGRALLREMDIRSPEVAPLFLRERPDVVMHLAAQTDVRVSVRDPVLDATLNIVGTLNVLEAARAAGVGRVVVASSGGCVYGDARVLPIAETARGRPASPYGISKRVLHDYLAYYRSVHGLSSAVLALSNVYGPRQDTTGEAGVVAIFLGAMWQERSTVIFGEGTQTRDFVFVGDVAEAFVSAIDRGEGVLNIGTGQETSVLELWELCARATGYAGTPALEQARPGELQRNALDTRKAGRALGWRARTALEDGIGATARFIKDAAAARPAVDVFGEGR